MAETVVQHHPTRAAILGVPEFAPTGSAGFLLDRYGMSLRASPNRPRCYSTHRGSEDLGSGGVRLMGQEVAEE